MSETELTTATEPLDETTPLAEDPQQQADKPKTKKAKTPPSSAAKPKPKKVASDDSAQSSSTQSTQSAQSAQPTQPKAKRGPARPHRRLAVEVIDTRITKLQKRLDRAKSQIEDAARHVEGYLRERDFRAKDASAEIQVAA
jgi:hypothetical protein